MLFRQSTVCGGAAVLTRVVFLYDTCAPGFEPSGIECVPESGPQPVGDEFQVNTFTDNRQDEPAIAMDADGDFVITWHSLDQDGSNWGVFAQRYSADGTPQGSEFQVNTFTDEPQFLSAIAMDADANFVITWISSGHQDGSKTGIFAQRFLADGTPQGSEFQVNTFTANDQILPAIAMDAGGNFVITWSSLDQDGSGFGIFAQRFQLIRE